MLYTIRYCLNLADYIAFEMGRYNFFASTSAFGVEQKSGPANTEGLLLLFMVMVLVLAVIIGPYYIWTYLNGQKKNKKSRKK